MAEWFVPVGGERWVGWHRSLALIHHGTRNLYRASWSPRANVRSAAPRFSMFTEIYFPSWRFWSPSSLMFSPVHPLPLPRPTLPIPLPFPSSVSPQSCVALILFLNKTLSPRLSPAHSPPSLPIFSPMLLFNCIHQIFFFPPPYAGLLLCQFVSSLFTLFHSAISLFT